MSKRMHFVAIATLALTAGVALAKPGPGPGPYMQGKMNEFCRAAKAGKADAMKMVVDSIFDPNAKIFSEGKDETYPQWRDEMIRQTIQMKPTFVELHATQVKVMGDRATDVTVFHARARVPNPKNPHKMSGLEIWSKSHTTLERKNGRWWITSDHDFEDKYLLDGKPFKPGN